VVREGYATAAAAAGVKTLFCRGFGRGFFIYIVYPVFCLRTVKTATPDPIRHRNLRCFFAFPR
jgi:hypothetical protein